MRTGMSVRMGEVRNVWGLSLQSAFVVVIVTAAGIFFQRMQACIMHPELSET